MHFDGFHVSIYFAKFSSTYLHILRNVDIDNLKFRDPKIKLHHTRLYNLMNPVDRTEFIREFVALLRFVAAGEADVGHLRKDSQAIHRAMDTKGNMEDDPVARPPQQDLDEREEEIWRTLNAAHYTA